MEPVEELRYLILAAQREGSRALTAALRPHELTPAQAEALAVLRDAGRPLTVRDVGRRLVCEGGSPSRLMSALQRKGLVQAEAGAVDRRTTVIGLTPAGAAAAQRVGEIEQQLYAGLRGALDDEQVESARALLAGLVAELPAGQALRRRIEDQGGA